MLQEALQVFESFQRFDQFLQIFQPPRRFGCFVILPHRGIAAFVQNDLGQFRVRDLRLKDHLRHRLFDPGIIIHDGLRRGHAAPAGNIIDQMAQSASAFAFDQPGLLRQPRAFDKGNTVAARGDLDGLPGLVTQPAFWRVHDPLKREIIIGRDNDAKIGHSIADLHPLVKTRPANDTIGQPQIIDWWRTTTDTAAMPLCVWRKSPCVNRIAGSSRMLWEIMVCSLNSCATRRVF